MATWASVLFQMGRPSTATIRSRNLIPARTPGQSRHPIDPTSEYSYIRKPANGRLTHDSALTKEKMLIAIMSAVNEKKIKDCIRIRLFMPSVIFERPFLSGLMIKRFIPRIKYKPLAVP